MSDSIAIVGMACEYPDARTPTQLWENVLAGRQAFRRFPSERLRLADYYSPDRSSPDRTYASQAAVLEGWEFDRVGFRVSGESFRSADLTHWLALDVAARALADAGSPQGEGLARPTTGVLVGNSLTGEFSRAQLLRLRWPYVRRVVGGALLAEGWRQERLDPFLAELEASFKEPFEPTTEETLAGGLSNTIAGRIANHFDLGGGAYTVDGACASSLLAVAQACSALAARDLDVVVVGGVDLSLDPFELVGFAKTHALAPDRMRVYDEGAAGFIPGEGCGFVVLMRHLDALAEERRVYALIRGWGISSDGAGGLTRPEVEGQLRAVRRAYCRAGFGIETVGYFEGHGTGTAVGDATELRVLSMARREACAAAPPAPIGSVKANIGHTKAAAGMAALIKAALAVHHQVLPPTTGCERPHAELRGDRAALKALARAEAWPPERPLRAGVSAMGFGGINTHVVVEGLAQRRRRALAAREPLPLFSWQDAELLVLAARNPTELLVEVERLEGVAARLSRAELTDVAAALASRCVGGRVRAALVATKPPELAAGLNLLRAWLLEGVTGPRLDAQAGVFLGAPSRPPRLGFLFPGQGSPVYPDGGAFARRYPEVAQRYERSALPSGAPGHDTATAQPAIVTASLAGVDTLDRLGIRARLVVGHSLGELTALAWAGALREDAAVRIAIARGRAMADLDGPAGAMASLAASAEVAAALAEGTDAVVAGYNAPRQTVVAGHTAAVEAVARRARERGVHVVHLPVSHAFHSPLMAPAVSRIAEALAAEEVAPLGRTVVSTVIGRPLSPADDLRAVLVQQVLSPVRFVEAVETVRDQVDLWLEVGPGRVLSRLLAELVDTPVFSTDAGAPSLRDFLVGLGAAFVLGSPLDVPALFADRFVRPFDLDRRLRFLVNPCELAAVADEAPEETVDSQVENRPQPPARDQGVMHTADLIESPLEVVRRLVAARTELPPEAVTDESRLLGDLHLSSISVGQVVVEAARSLGFRPPASPTDFANATIGQVAHALAEAASAPDGATDAVDPVIAGVDSWVRAFTVELVESPAPVTPPMRGGGVWQIVAQPEHPLRERLGHALASLDGNGVVLCLPEALDEQSIGLFLEASRLVLDGLRENAPQRCFVVVQQHGGGGGFARTLHLEHPEVATAVVDLSFDHPQAATWVAAECALLAAQDGYCEAHYDADGRRRRPMLHLLDSAGEEALPQATILGPEDVLLATGGGKGIVAECALALARASGARLGIIGRSQPREDAELAANLARMSTLGVETRYFAADVCDAAALTAAVGAVRAELGSITALLHGAGTNTPRLVTALTEADFRATVAPKVEGFRNLLGAVETDRLKLLITFGSIIARLGLRGEADYAAANEWLALATERFEAEHPSCRCLSLEWSVWSGVGMGERLGRLETLIRQGVTPIPPDVGVAMLNRLLARPAPAVSVVVAGRFGDPPTLGIEPRELPLLRFLERPRVYYPGVELVTEVELSADNDPYLVDHVVGGERLFPAVMGMEAMAQLAMAVTGADELPVFEDIEFHQPVVVGEGEPLTLRLAALVRAPGRVETVLRTSATGFVVDHFRCVCDFRRDIDREHDRSSIVEIATDQIVPLLPQADLYGRLLFHGGRFRRLRAYRALRATECLAEISPDGETSWFGSFLPQDLMLGDAAARDAAVHGLQPCVPHVQILPVGVDRVIPARLSTSATWLLSARERRREGDTFVYDLEIVDSRGRLAERWEGLRLRIVKRLSAPDAWPAPLLGPYVERRLQELLRDAPPAVLVERLVHRRDDQPGEATSDPVVRHLLGTGPAARPLRRSDGKPETVGGPRLSTAHAGDVVLAVASRGPVGCDLEAVAERSPEVWRDLLGPERTRLVDAAMRRGDSLAAAGTRIWAAVECLKKAGALHDAPLVLATEPAADRDGWLVLRSGRFSIGTVVTHVVGCAAPLALAVLTAPGGDVG